jgi:hypothetical protein
MEITEPHGLRFELALERLRDGHAFTFRGVGFWLAPDGSLEVRVPSSWGIENTSEQTALSDLEHAKKLLDVLIVESPSFASLVKDRARRFVLIDDYGMGGVELCRLVGGALIWAKGMAQSKGEI